jgi:hypothetical protein
MSKFISIRGWIECDKEYIPKIKDIISYFSKEYSKYPIEQETKDLYQKGWNIPADTINWTAYIFYGADIREYNSDFIKDEITAIAESNKEIEGYFFVDDDEGEKKLYWRVYNGKIIETERSDKELV